MGSFAPPIGRSLHFLATRRKGGVQRSEAFGVFIDDACHGRGPRIRFELENGRLAETRSSQRAGRNSIWSKIRPAGSCVCSATSRVRPGAPLAQLPLCNSPLLPPAACNHRRRIQSGAQRRQLGPGRQQSFSLRRTVSGRYPLPGVLIWAGDFNGTLAHNVILRLPTARRGRLGLCIRFCFGRAHEDGEIVVNLQ